ncbi:putative aldouronate transport system permease protein [Anaerocolumna jejuensis DSM 15929]|uniref:Putative aldouronate transport system permease protein n=2 Tax=Anaerocolumna TaxID=1843210 RepID=A0A1M7AHS3_9FIRM|nr:putative aldouronate transport system permease protein [Anaerocolumna jejuensis DSM 15929]
MPKILQYRRCAVLLGVKMTYSRKLKKTGKEFAFNIAVNSISILIIIIVLVPLIFVLAASFSDPDLVLKGKVLLFPKGFTLKAYHMVFENSDIWRGYLNTIIYTVAGTAISVVLTILAAYPLSRSQFFGRKYLLLILLFTMYFNGGMIPTYLLVRDMGMYDSIWAIILPSAISTYNLIVAKTFFETSIPNELYESALLDGCGNIKMLNKIVLPLAKSIIAILILYYAVNMWNSYFSALIYLNDDKKYPLQIILRNILLIGQTEQFGTNDVGMAEKIKMAEALKYSVIVVSSIPMIILYQFVQKHFVKGVMIGAIKG